MTNKIFVSTGSFKSKNIVEILDTALKHQITHIELSSGLDFHEDMAEVLRGAKSQFEFLVHNYFPAPAETFILNLASTDKSVQDKSLTLCKRAIDFVKSFDGDFYSVHAGFVFDGSGTELGSPTQLKLRRIPIEIAMKQFVQNVIDLCQYAEKLELKIAIENNVLAQYAADEQDIYLGVTHQDIARILSEVNCANLGVLLDLAHAKVSDTFLNFGIAEMISQLEDKVLAVHVSDNNGSFDENLKLNKQSDLIPHIKRLKDKILVLESYHLEPEEIQEQIKFLEELTND